MRARSAKSSIPVAADTTLFHDGDGDALAWRQHVQENGLAGLVVETTGFRGKFVSLAVALPDEYLPGLAVTSILAVNLTLELATACDVGLRLNLRRGPNVTEYWQNGIVADRGQRIEFELSGVAAKPAALDAVWIDLLFNRPGTNSIAIREVWIQHRPRAEF